MRSLDFELHDFHQNEPGRITGSIEQKAGQLLLHYEINTGGKNLIWPERSAKPEFRDLLWQGSCLEVFYALPSASSYIEWNFSPAGHWACYQFARYREGMQKLSDEQAKIDSGHDGNHYWLQAVIPCDASAQRIFNICTILQHNAGQSFWSVHHPAAKPDFHDRAGFVLRF